ncbi:MAG: peptidoglycan DD-metalloendopeptidase family protein [Alphaproteobacteria bacterium]|nr:peptidoglycan DD-metalloendopeptidase family protein [Alphaproteobacteria bacterium]
MRHKFSYHKDYKRTKRNFWESIGQFISGLFPEKVAVFYNRGTVSQKRISSNLQLFLAVFSFIFIGWVGYSSYVYFRYNHIMEDNAAKVEKAHEQYKQLLAVVSAYENQISEINDKIDSQNTELAKKLDSQKSIPKEDQKEFFKNQRILVAELGYFSKKMRDFAASKGFSDFDKEEVYYRLKNAEIQRDVAWKEQKRVKKRNIDLEDAIIQVRSSYEGLLDKMEVLASDRVKDLEKQFAGVSRTLKRLGLKDKTILIGKLKAEERVSIGGPFVPLKEDKLPSENLTKRYNDVRDKVNLWEGLSKVKEMLPLGNPVEKMRVTSSFGSRSDPFTGKAAMHGGIDFAGKIGKPLYAVAAGHVSRAGLRGAYGYAVEIDHGLGFSTLYAHLSKITVKVGDEVNERDIVGLAGSTGRSTGVHLHYEVRYNGRPINPYAFVKAKFIDYGKAIQK